MKRGEVYRFNYLWGHEAEKGREGSRKLRRVCLMMQVGDWLYLFPITSLKPTSEQPSEPRIFEEIPAIEKRRIGLSADTPSYLVLDDFNRVRSDRLYDFESLEPLGALSLKFLAIVAHRFRDAVAQQRPIAGRTRT